MAVITPQGHGLGCRPQLGDIRDLKVADHLTLPDEATLPPLIDLRNELPDPYDQGQEGSCTAVAAGAVYRHARRKRHGWPLPKQWQPSLHYGGLEDFDISFAAEYFLTRKLEGTEQYDAGASIRDAVKSLAVNGCAAWHNMPYVPGDFATPPSANTIANASHHKVAHYYALDGSITQYHQALALGYLPIFGITVYDSYYRAQTTGNVPMPKSTDKVLGGHALVMVGIDAPNQECLVRGSWGQWGDKGHLHFPWAYLLDPNLTFDPWCLDIGSL